MSQINNSKIYSIPEQNYSNFISKIIFLNKKIDNIKRKAPSIQMDKISINIVDIEKTTQYSKVLQKDLEQKIYKIQIAGSSPIINGWKFLVSVHHLRKAKSLPDKNMLVNLSSLTENEINEYVNTKPKCDHCKLSRIRNNTFIIENIKTGAKMQIGSSCINEFFGTGNPHLIAKIFAAFNNVTDNIENSVINKIDYLELSNALVVLGHILTQGPYVSYTTVAEFKSMFDIKHPNLNLANKINDINDVDQQNLIKKGLERLSWINENSPSTNEFQQKIKSMADWCLTTGTLKYSDIGLFCYASKYYTDLKLKMEMTEKREADKTNLSVNEILLLYPIASKKKITLTFRKKSEGVNQWGNVTRYYFKDENNITFQHNAYASKKTLPDFQEDEKYNVECKISTVYNSEFYNELVLMIKNLKVL